MHYLDSWIEIIRIALIDPEEAKRLRELAIFQKLYVGSLHFSLTESDVKQVFEPFGATDSVHLHKDPITQRSKGFGFVQ